MQFRTGNLCITLAMSTDPATALSDVEHMMHQDNVDRARGPVFRDGVAGTHWHYQ